MTEWDVILGTQEPKRGLGATAVFIARNRFAVLDKANNQIQVRNLQNEVTKKSNSPTATTDAIFYAGTGALLCRSDDKVTPDQCKPSPQPLKVSQQRLMAGAYERTTLTGPGCGYELVTSPSWLTVA